ncbi:hypothetical protein ABIF65_009576 [Bradyrhizobium japonicum]
MRDGRRVGLILGVVPDKRSADPGSITPGRSLTKIRSYLRRYEDRPSPIDYAVWVPAFAGTTADSPPVQQPRLQPADHLPHHEPEHRQDHHAREQLIRLHQIAGLKHEGADTVLGADHFGTDDEQ